MLAPPSVSTYIDCEFQRTASHGSGAMIGLNNPSQRWLRLPSASHCPDSDLRPTSPAAKGFTVICGLHVGITPSHPSHCAGSGLLSWLGAAGLGRGAPVLDLNCVAGAPSFEVPPRHASSFSGATLAGIDSQAANYPARLVHAGISPSRPLGASINHEHPPSFFLLPESGVFDGPSIHSILRWPKKRTSIFLHDRD